MNENQLYYFIEEKDPSDFNYFEIPKNRPKKQELNYTHINIPKDKEYYVGNHLLKYNIMTGNYTWN